MKVAIIGGTGRQGFGLALRLAQGGLEVILGSRAKEKAEGKAKELSERLAALELKAEAEGRISGLENLAAAEAAELVFLTVPYPAGKEIAAALKPALNGKILVDVSVPLKSYKPPEVEMPPEGSAAEEIQALLGAGVKVVGAFKETPAQALADLERELESDVLVCGDDPEAKEKVITLCRDAGLRAFDAGPLAVARTVERLTALLIGLNQRYKRKAVGIRLTGI
ncbi:MAG: NADPH-dependent F420 reductase [Candidatus Bipolaricaulia bacterium]